MKKLLLISLAILSYNLFAETNYNIEQIDSFIENNNVKIQELYDNESDDYFNLGLIQYETKRKKCITHSCRDKTANLIIETQKRIIELQNHNLLLNQVKISELIYHN